VLYGEDIALGPGKVELLEWFGETGSIREAAERMGMSYMRAWKLIQTMNECFREPLVQAVRGGPQHGGARLTQTGEEALHLYRTLESQCFKATAKSWRKLLPLFQRVT
jgi:molybdate transport system regulatory protein